MTLTEFLLARIAEDEAVARDAAEVPPLHSNRWQLSTVKVETLDGVTHTRPRGTVEAAPRRVLAECEAKLRIVEYATNQHTSGPDWDLAVGFLAAVYADHPDYREEWKP